MNIKDKMALPPLLKRDANVRLLEGKWVPRFGTRRPPLHKGSQFQSVLYGSDIQTLEDGVHHLIVI